MVFAFFIRSVGGNAAAASTSSTTSTSSSCIKILSIVFYLLSLSVFAVVVVEASVDSTTKPATTCTPTISTQNTTERCASSSTSSTSSTSSREELQMLFMSCGNDTQSRSNPFKIEVRAQGYVEPCRVLNQTDNNNNTNFGMIYTACCPRMRLGVCVEYDIRYSVLLATNNNEKEVAAYVEHMYPHTLSCTSIAQDAERAGKIIIIVCAILVVVLGFCVILGGYYMRYGGQRETHHHNHNHNHNHHHGRSRSRSASLAGGGGGGTNDD
eukprot:PhM_4_TR6748/c0_g1_i1/m.16211